MSIWPASPTKGIIWASLSSPFLCWALILWFGCSFQLLWWTPCLKTLFPSQLYRLFCGCLLRLQHCSNEVKDSGSSSIHEESALQPGLCFSNMEGKINDLDMKKILVCWLWGSLRFHLSSFLYGSRSCLSDRFSANAFLKGTVQHNIANEFVYWGHQQDVLQGGCMYFFSTWIYMKTVDKLIHINFQWPIVAWSAICKSAYIFDSGNIHFGNWWFPTCFG